MGNFYTWIIHKVKHSHRKLSITNHRSVAKSHTANQGLFDLMHCAVTHLHNITENTARTKYFQRKKKMFNIMNKRLVYLYDINKVLRKNGNPKC